MMMVPSARRCPTQTTTYVPSEHSTVGYRISNKSVKYNETNRMQVRNPDQAVYRVQIEHVESDGGVNYAGHNHYTSVYLGQILRRKSIYPSL